MIPQARDRKAEANTPVHPTVYPTKAREQELMCPSVKGKPGYAWLTQGVPGAHGTDQQPGKNAEASLLISEGGRKKVPQLFPI